MTTHPAIEHFEQQYADRSGMTVQELHAWGSFGSLCDCDEEGCDGFQMGSLRYELIDAGWTPPRDKEAVVSVDTMNDPRLHSYDDRGTTP